MAAGLSTRFKRISHGQHKLLAKCENSPLSVLETTTKTVQKAFQNSPIFILTNEQETTVTELACQLSAQVIALQSDGLSTSIAKGINILKQLPESPALKQLFILPADLPFIQRETLILLQGRFEKSSQKIIRPTFQGIPGHPVGFHHSLFDELGALSGDLGAKTLLQKHPTEKISVLDPGILWDIDTPSDFTTYPGTLAWCSLDAKYLKNRA